MFGSNIGTTNKIHHPGVVGQEVAGSDGQRYFMLPLPKTTQPVRPAVQETCDDFIPLITQLNAQQRDEAETSRETLAWRRERMIIAHNRLTQVVQDGRVPRFFLVSVDQFGDDDRKALTSWESRYGRENMDILRTQMHVAFASFRKSISNPFISFSLRDQDFRCNGNRQRAKVTKSTSPSSWLERKIRVWMALVFPKSSSDGFHPITRQLTESMLYAFVTKSRRHEFSYRETQRCLRSWKGLVDRLRSLRNAECHDFDLLKYWTNFFVWKLSASLDDPPEKPAFAGTNLFTGWMKTFIGRRFNKKDMSFFLSWQQSKRYWPQLSSEKEYAALLKHQKLLSTKAPPLPEDSVKQIKMVCNMVFFGKKASRSYTKLCPSRSACLQSSRQNGGALALFGPFSPVLPSQAQTKLLGPTGAAEISFREWRDDIFETALSKISRPLPGYEYTHCNTARIDGELAFIDVSEHLAMLARGNYYQDREIDLQTKVEIIPEPAKFRPITKMDGFLATALQPLQGNLLSCWKQTRWNTMSKDVDERVREIASSSREPLWCSGDFQASTDYISSEASEVALRFVLNRIYSPLDDELIVKSLCATLIEYPVGEYEKAGFKGLLPSILQRNGQLMGHPLSFPFLCVINLAYYFTAIERFKETLIGWSREEVRERTSALRRNVIVNGDDILFKCDEVFFGIWRQVTAQGGLLLSPGKSYLSKNFLQINSRSYYEKNGRVSRIGYLNLKLVLGYSLKSGDTDVMPEQVGKDLSAMVDLAPWTQSSLPLAFKRWERRFLGRFRPNWFLPPHLGGYGVSPRWALKEDIGLTKWQRKVAAMFVNDPKLALTRSVLKRKRLDPALRKIVPPVSFVRFGDEVPVGYSPMGEDWTARLSLYASLLDSKPMKPDQFLFKENRSWMAAKPMSVKKIISYIAGEWYSATRSHPPQLLDIGYARLATAEKRPNGRRFCPNSSRVDFDFGEGYVLKTQNTLNHRVVTDDHPGVLNKMSRDCTESGGENHATRYLEDLENLSLVRDGQSAEAGPCQNQKPTRARQAHPVKTGVKCRYQRGPRAS